jgi:hypothetical protein
LPSSTFSFVAGLSFVAGVVEGSGLKAAVALVCKSSARAGQAAIVTANATDPNLNIVPLHP